MDCEWSAWQTGPCSVSCGGGTRTSNRSKTVEENYGGECIGQPIFQEVCNTQNCPSKGKINESLNIKNANTLNIYISFAKDLHNATIRFYLRHWGYKW